MTLLPWFAALLLSTTPAPDFGDAVESLRGSPALKSVVVADGQRILAQLHQRGGGLHRATNVKSVSKSVLAALAGVAVARGELQLDQPIAEFLPNYRSLLQDPVRARITVEDLLTMRTGLETTSFFNYGKWVAGRDWVRGQLTQPVVAEPGTAMRYSTGASHLFSVVLKNATGRPTRDYARRHLNDPLGLRAFGWERDPQGNDFGGNNLTMTPAQMARFGQLWLNDGRIEGRRVLPEGWVERCWEPRTRSPWNGYSYGYFWWIREIAGERVCYAWGHGGQRIFVLPELDLVVVTTAATGASGRSRSTMSRLVDRFLSQEVIPMARAGIRRGGAAETEPIPSGTKDRK